IHQLDDLAPPSCEAYIGLDAPILGLELELHWSSAFNQAWLHLSAPLRLQSKKINERCINLCFTNACPDLGKQSTAKVMSLRLEFGCWPAIKRTYRVLVNKIEGSLTNAEPYVVS